MPNQVKPTVVEIIAAAREAADRNRVPPRPAEMTVEAYLAWRPAYLQQCITDGYLDMLTAPSKLFPQAK